MSPRKPNLGSNIMARMFVTNAPLITLTPSNSRSAQMMLLRKKSSENGSCAGILEWISSLPLLTEFHKRASQQQLCVQTLVDSEGVTNELGNCTRIIQNTIHQLSNISILRMHNLVSNQDLVNKAFTLRIDIAQTLQRPEQDQLQLEQVTLPPKRKQMRHQALSLRLCNAIQTVLYDAAY